MYKKRRFFGTFLGVALAAVLLPGIHSTTDELPWDVVLSGLAFVIVNQLIYTYPHDIRSARPILLLVMAAIGIVQDTLIWLGLGWLSDEMQFGLRADDFLTAVLGGAIVRTAVLALLAIGPRPTEQAA
jgi:putative membrane protein